MNDLLIPASPGELFDKISILALKRVKISNRQQLDNVEREFSRLKTVADGIVESLSRDLRAKLDAMKSELYAVNQRLWDVEDHLRDREREKNFDERFIELARSVYLNNDERSAIKKKINVLLNSNIVEEKSYKPY